MFHSQRNKFNLNKAKHYFKASLQSREEQETAWRHGKHTPSSKQSRPARVSAMVRILQRKSAHNKLNKAYLGAKITITLKNLNTHDLYKKITRLDSIVRVN